MMSKVACFVPIKHNSQRVVGKNLRTLGDKPLYRHTLDIIKDMDCFDDVYVDTDSYEIISYCANNNIKTIPNNIEVTHKSLNDYSIEGIQCSNLNLFTSN